MWAAPLFCPYEMKQKSKGRGETGGRAYGDVSLLRFQKQYHPLQVLLWTV